MRIKKAMGVFALTLAGMLCLASCSKTGSATSPTTAEDDGAVKLTSRAYTSISVDTANAKTLYYLGEKFTADGLVVTNNFVKYYSDGSRETEHYQTVSYSVDTSEVDFNTVGTYKVLVSSRVGSTIRDASYNIVIKSSQFDDYKDISYISGIKVEYNSGEDSFIKTYKVQDSFSFSKDNIKCSGNLVTIDNDGNKTETTATIRTTNISIDTSNIPVDSNGKLTTRGTFYIKYTFTQEVTVGDKKITNIVESFTYVNVENPVTSFEKYSSGDTTFEASINKFDYSKWQFKVSREIGDAEIVNYSDELFTITGLNQYAPGSQNATITLKEDVLKSIVVNVTVTESNQYNILVSRDLNYGLDYTVAEDGTKTYTGKSDNNRVQLDETGYVFATKVSREAKPRSCGSLSFSIRCKIESSAKGGQFEVVMPKSGKLLIYIASTGDDARPVTVNNGDGETVNELTASNKDIPQEYQLSLDAGTYTFTCASNGFYVYGVIIATDK